MFTWHGNDAYDEFYSGVNGLPTSDFVNQIQPVFPDIQVRDGYLVIESDYGLLDPSYLTVTWLNGWVDIYNATKDGAMSIWDWAADAVASAGRTLDGLCNPITAVETFVYTGSPTVVDSVDFHRSVYPAFCAGVGDGLVSVVKEPYLPISGYAYMTSGAYSDTSKPSDFLAYFAMFFLGYDPDSTYVGLPLSISIGSYNGLVSGYYVSSPFVHSNGYFPSRFGIAYSDNVFNYYASGNAQYTTTFINNHIAFATSFTLPFMNRFRFFNVFQVIPLYLVYNPLSSLPTATPHDIITDYYNEKVYTAPGIQNPPDVSTPEYPEIEYPATPDDVTDLNGLKSWLSALAASFALAVGRLASDLTSMASYFTVINTKVDDLAGGVADVGAAVGAMSGTLDGVYQRVGELGGSIDGLGLQVGAMGGSLDGVNQRLGELGGSIDSVGQRVGELGGSIDGVGTRIDGLEGALSGGLADVNANVGALSGQLAGVEGQVGALAGSMPGIISDSMTGAMSSALAETDVNMSGFELRPLILQKFPFCIPFDMADFVKTFLAEPRAPAFVFDLRETVLGDYGGDAAVMTLDFGDPRWADIVKVIRFFTFAMFVVGLMVLTSKVIKW